MNYPSLRSQVWSLLPFATSLLMNRGSSVFHPRCPALAANRGRGRQRHHCYKLVDHAMYPWPMKTEPPEPANPYTLLRDSSVHTLAIQRFPKAAGTTAGVARKNPGPKHPTLCDLTPSGKKGCRQALLAQFSHQCHLCPRGACCGPPSC